jgi:hypothetical protein
MAYSETSVRRCFDSREQVVVHRVGGDGERTVDDSAIDMDTKVDLENIVILKYDFFSAGVGGPMSSTIVQSQTSRESLAGLESISGLDAGVTDQSANTVFNFLSQRAHRHAGFRDRLHVLPDLAVGFGSFAIVFQEVLVHLLHGSLMAGFLGRSATQVIVEIGIFDNLAFRIRSPMEDVGERLSRRRGLLASGRFRFLLLVALTFFLFACGF